MKVQGWGSCCKGTAVRETPQDPPERGSPPGGGAAQRHLLQRLLQLLAPLTLAPEDLVPPLLLLAPAGLAAQGQALTQLHQGHLPFQAIPGRLAGDGGRGVGKALGETPSLPCRPLSWLRLHTSAVAGCGGRGAADLFPPLKTTLCVSATQLLRPVPLSSPDPKW